jgi:hypothetical protein
VIIELAPELENEAGKIFPFAENAEDKVGSIMAISQNQRYLEQ